MENPIDPVALTADLIRCETVTPDRGEGLEVLRALLEPAGFTCVRVDRGGVANLFARWGPKGAARSFGFNGHTDVVPPGDPADWSVGPFDGIQKEGQIWGRGAADMKSGVAAFVAAAIDHVMLSRPDGAIILTITGDEEGASVDGTTALLDWMQGQGEAMHLCLVGEPTSLARMGDVMKIGRRGSMAAWITATGVQGHSAYPDRAKNPVAAMARLIDHLSRHRLDEGSAHFDASTLAVTTIDTGNPATNVIPHSCRATVNIRFNDHHSGASLTDWLRAELAAMAQQTGVAFDMQVKISGESFFTPPGALSDLVAASIRAETGRMPELSTTGGTSDARFIRAHCPVVEFGLVGQTMHKVDERVEVAHIHQLKAIYGRILRDYFA